MRGLLGYLATLSPGRTILWCYLIWYVEVTVRYFDPTPSLWISATGMSAIIGIALVLSTQSPQRRLEPWAIFRLFLMPFCVSSYSMLIKGHGFLLIFPPRIGEVLCNLAGCGLFIAAQVGARTLHRSSLRREAATGV